MWYAKPTGAYAKESTEAIANMTEVKNYLMAQGWTLNACCGVMGNIGNEGGYNPWRWQDDILLTRAESAVDTSGVHGYGMYGYTNSNKYINSISASYQGYGPNFADYNGLVTDGMAQTIWVIEHPDQFQTRVGYPYSDWTLQRYINSTDSVQTLAEVWCWDWELPEDPYASLAWRREHAQFWWDYFEGGPTPPPPTPPKPLRFKKTKWWMYMPPPRPMPF